MNWDIIIIYVYSYIFPELHKERKVFLDQKENYGEIEIYDEKEKFRSCDIPVILNGELTDNRLIFFFLNGKLNRIDFWEPS